jgi:hypothetical protein
MIQEFKRYIYYLAFVVTGILPFFFHYGHMNDGKNIFHAKSVFYYILGLSTTLTLVLFPIKKDKINLSWAD